MARGTVISACGVEDDANTQCDKKGIRLKEIECVRCDGGVAMKVSRATWGEPVEEVVVCHVDEKLGAA